MLGEEATCLERPLAGRELASCPVQWEEVTLPFCKVAGGLPMSLKGSQPSLWEFSQDAGGNSYVQDVQAPPAPGLAGSPGGHLEKAENAGGSAGAQLRRGFPGLVDALWPVRACPVFSECP